MEQTEEKRSVVTERTGKVDLGYIREDKQDSDLAKMMAVTDLPPSVGDIIEGTVIGLDKNAVYVNLAPFGTGIIFGREYMIARDIIKRLHAGDTVTGKIVTTDGEDGYIEISLKEARQAILWEEAEKAVESKEVFELPVTEANKGGLILSWQGIQGFLPASQLKTEHYPRVEDGDKDRILDELRKLIGEKLHVSIITADSQEGKLIFSEKDPDQKNKESIIDKYTVGDIVEGEITGTVEFGVFVKIEEGLEGLVHISEIDWSLVEDPRKLFNIGEKVKLKIIDVKDDKISLSIKALKENPWVKAKEKYQKGALVNGVVIKFNKHGALASIEEGIAGLVHVSEFGSQEKLRETLELGKTYPFRVSLIDVENQKMALKYKTDEEPKKEE